MYVLLCATDDADLWNVCVIMSDFDTVCLVRVWNAPLVLLTLWVCSSRSRLWLCLWWYALRSVCMSAWVCVEAMYRRSPCARGRVHFDFSEEVIRRLHAANHGHTHRLGRTDNHTHTSCRLSLNSVLAVFHLGSVFSFLLTSGSNSWTYSCRNPSLNLVVFLRIPELLMLLCMHLVYI